MPACTLSHSRADMGGKDYVWSGGDAGGEKDSLPEDEQGVLIKIISAYVRDYRAKQAYAS